MGSKVVYLVTLLQICWPGFSGSGLHSVDELDDDPPKAKNAFPPPPPPNSNIRIKESYLKTFGILEVPKLKPTMVTLATCRAFVGKN